MGQDGMGSDQGRGKRCKCGWHGGGAGEHGAALASIASRHVCIPNVSFEGTEAKWEKHGFFFFSFLISLAGFFFFLLYLYCSKHSLAWG